MISRMNVVQNAARLAMADHRSADAVLKRRSRRNEGFSRAGMIFATALAFALTFALLAGFGG